MVYLNLNFYLNGFMLEKCYFTGFYSSYVCVKQKKTINFGSYCFKEYDFIEINHRNNKKN